MWQRIQQQISQDKVPHALLLSGQQGIGKWHFAESLADYLLCLSPKADLACGECRSCQLLKANTHPDKKVFMPEAMGKAIKIDQVRELSQFVSKTAQQGGRKVVLLGPVEQLNINSANALLKNLEEPAGDTVMILMTHVQSAVMATIRSRCQLLPLTAPNKALAIEWLSNLQVDDAETLLRLAGGAPLVAKEMVEGDYLEHLQLFVKVLDELTHSTTSQQVPDIHYASEWLPMNLSYMTEWWLQIIHSMLTNADNSSEHHSKDDAGSEVTHRVQRIVAKGKLVNKQWLFKFSDKLLVLRQQYLQGSNPNMQLLIEELLLDWQAIVQRPS